MIRTTTPTHTFVFPFNPAELDELWITYKQNGMILINKELPDLTVDSEKNSVEFVLSQEETASFNDNIPVYIQIKCRQGSTVMASETYKVRVVDVLNDNFMGQS